MKALILFLIISCSLPLFAKEKDTSKVEWMKVYFNSISDHRVATPNNESNDNYDLIQTLVDRINAAQFSIDLAAYEFENMRVGHALAKAARRGVLVRVVTDDDTRSNQPEHNIPMWDTLRSVGIISIDDAGTIYYPDGRIVKLDEPLTNSGAIMHNKFAIFDARNEDPNDDYVWTGSMNMTYTGPWNTNAVMVIKDDGIAKSYMEEFEQMWGSKKEEPKAFRAKFHKNKYPITQNIHYVDSIKVEVYFSPMNRSKTKKSISKRITHLINEYAKNDVEFLAFAISPTIPISQAMIDRSARGEIRLSGVIDPRFYTQYKNKKAIWAQPQMTFGNRMVVSARETRKLHSKTMIIDANYAYPEKHNAIVVAGSYNFSKAAEYSNDENVLIIHNTKIANQFYQDFKGILNRALGKSFARAPELDTNKWYYNFRFGRDGGIEVELAPDFYYPVKLLGVNIPRTWAGHKDSCYYYSSEGHEYLHQLVKGSALKITAGKEKPANKYGKYYGYVTAKTPDGIIQVNHELIKSGNATYSDYGRQQRDSILSFKFAEQVAKKNSQGLWKYPDSVGVKKLTEEAKHLQDLFPLDINTTPAHNLTYIKGIGPKTAERIIKYRKENGKIKAFNELLSIKGIGPATLKKIQSKCVINQ